MADEERRDAVTLRALDHPGGDLAKLRDRTRGTLERARTNRLHAVEDERGRLHFSDDPLDDVEVVLGEDEELVRRPHLPFVPARNPPRSRPPFGAALSTPET